MDYLRWVLSVFVIAYIFGIMDLHIIIDHEIHGWNFIYDTLRIGMKDYKYDNSVNSVNSIYIYNLSNHI